MVASDHQPPGFDSPFDTSELRYLLIALIAGALLWPLHTLQPVRAPAASDQLPATTVAAVVERNERDPPLPAFAGHSERTVSNEEPPA